MGTKALKNTEKYDVPTDTEVVLQTVNGNGKSGF